MSEGVWQVEDDTDLDWKSRHQTRKSPVSGSRGQWQATYEDQAARGRPRMLSIDMDDTEDDDDWKIRHQTNRKSPIPTLRRQWAAASGVVAKVAKSSDNAVMTVNTTSDELGDDEDDMEWKIRHQTRKSPAASLFKSLHSNIFEEEKTAKTPKPKSDMPKTPTSKASEAAKENATRESEAPCSMPSGTSEACTAPSCAPLPTPARTQTLVTLSTPERAVRAIAPATETRLHTPSEVNTTLSVGPTSPQGSAKPCTTGTRKSMGNVGKQRPSMRTRGSLPGFPLDDSALELQRASEEAKPDIDPSLDNLSPPRHRTFEVYESNSGGPTSPTSLAEVSRLMDANVGAGSTGMDYFITMSPVASNVSRSSTTEYQFLGYPATSPVGDSCISSRRTDKSLSAKKFSATATAIATTTVATAEINVVPEQPLCMPRSAPEVMTQAVENDQRLSYGTTDSMLSTLTDEEPDWSDWELVLSHSQSPHSTPYSSSEGTAPQQPPAEPLQPTLPTMATLVTISPESDLLLPASIPVEDASDAIAIVPCTRSTDDAASSSLAEFLPVAMPVHASPSEASLLHDLMEDMIEAMESTELIMRYMTSAQGPKLHFDIYSKQTTDVNLDEHDYFDVINEDDIDDMPSCSALSVLSTTFTLDIDIECPVLEDDSSKTILTSLRRLVEMAI